jgi:FkbM family methyltransferase
MKNYVKKLVRSLGYDIVRYKEEDEKIENRKSVRSEELTLHDTTTGKYYLPTDAHQDIVANAIINNRIFEEEIVECAKKYIRPGSIVLDVGANYGQMTVLFSKIVNDNGKIYSFEANNFVFEVLKKNILVNNCSNVEPVFGAVHNVENEILIFPEQNFERFGAYGSYGIDYNKSKSGKEVRSLTIDSLNLSSNVSFMNVDIQGGDLFAMKGAIQTIKRNKMPILFEFEYLFQDDIHLDFQEYVDFVADIGYRFARVINGQNYLILPKK